MEVRIWLLQLTVCDNWEQYHESVSVFSVWKRTGKYDIVNVQFNQVMALKEATL